MVRRLGAAVVLVVVGTSCAGPPTVTTRTGRALTLPSVPVTDRPGIRIDPAHIDDAACDRCDAAGGVLGVEEFLYGDLAVDAFRRLAAPSRPGATERAVLLGDLVVSGYHGGRWLASELDSLGAGATDPVADAVALAVSDGLFAALADLVAATSAAAGTADPALAAGTSALLLAVYGYNRGYLDLALERPPPGVSPDPDAVHCATPLSCTSGRFPLGAVDRWTEVDGLLAAPPSDTWTAAAGQVDALLGPSLDAGRGVWERILAGSGFSATSYGALIDTSAGFLAVTGLALRASLTGWADADPAAARASLDLAAGLVAWAGSYFLGLAAPAGGPLPTLDCPEA